MFPFSLLFGQKRRNAENNADGRSVLARIDSLRNSPQNIKHWDGVESISADAMFDHDTRKRARDRARHERLNNTYCHSLVSGFVEDIIGTGPRLNILADRSNKVSNIEKDWRSWSNEVDLPEKLRLFADSKIVDGESFCIKISNPKVAGPVRLDLAQIEAERVCSETASAAFVSDPLYIDGIRFDTAGNPVSYRVLDEHPGSAFCFNNNAKIYPADSIIHWFRRIRGEQHRGLSELSPALPLFAYLRRYTLAVLANAETTANFSAVLYTDMPDCDRYHPGAFDVVDVERNAMVTLPEGWKMAQLKPEQPGSTYEMFKRETLSEIGRTLGVPVNIMTGYSAKHNYSSARMDQQSYRRTIAVTRKELEIAVLGPIFRDWWNEYSIATGTPTKYGRNISWYWDGFMHVDPKKEADARKTLLDAGMTNLSIEYSSLGYDVEDQIRQRVREEKMIQELRKEYGLANQTTQTNGETGPGKTSKKPSSEKQTPSVTKKADSNKQDSNQED